MDIKELIKSKASTNAATKNLSSAELEKIIGLLSDRLDAIKKREAASNEKKKAAAIKKLQTMMAGMDLTPADLAALTPGGGKKRGRKPGAGKKGSKKPRGKVAPKYEITVDGQRHAWTGRGRTPVVFKNHVEQGGSLEDCLIK